MNIEAIRDAADREAGTSPHDRDMPPTSWDWSPELRAQLVAYEEARAAHAEAWGELTLLVTDLDEAIAADETDRRRAAREGRKDPGTGRSEKAATALEFARFAAEERRRVANAAFPDQQILAEVQARQAEFAAALTDRVTAATENHQTAISEARTIVTRAERRLDGLRNELLWAAGKFHGVTLGGFGVGYDETRWPTPAALETHKWLRKIQFVEEAAPALTVDTSFDAAYADGTRPGDN